MSLINDAIKRASEAQTNAENIPSPEFKFRGVEPGEKRPQPKSWIWLCAIAVGVIVCAAILWRSTRAQKNEDLNSQPATGKATHPDNGTMKVHAREENPLPGGPLVATKPVEAVQTERVAVVAVSGTSIQEIPKPDGTNGAAASSDRTKPAAPKLQAVVYNPANPSAIISGKTVFAGDRFGEWRVLKVTQDSATLVKPGETNILKLGE